MIEQLDAARLGAQDKAALIFAQARSEMSNRLWRAALGGAQDDRPLLPNSNDMGESGLDALLTLLTREGAQTVTPPLSHPAAAVPQGRTAPILAEADPEGGSSSSHSDGSASDDAGSIGGGLGPNTPYLGTLNAAAARTGIPAAALAAIVHAEAAKGPDGRWLTYSRNTRSSAAGLGQFLSGTWIGEAEQSGTWLNALAASRGWLDGRGRVLSRARSALLALRYDGNASIQTIADYASTNLAKLRAAGIAVGNDVGSIARTAYTSHYLGLGDAIRFFKDELAPARAQMLLRVQIGAGAADERIARAGSATRAHRDWFLGYMARNLRPERFELPADSVRLAARPSSPENL